MDTGLDLARCWRSWARFDDAAEAREQALVRFEQKESLAGAARVRQRLEVPRAAQIS